MSKKTLRVLFVIVFLISLVGIGVGLWQINRVTAVQEFRVPMLRSDVPGVEIEIAKFTSDGRLLKLQIRNNTNSAITGFTVSCGEFSSTYEPAIETDDEIILAAPGGLMDAAINSKNLKEGLPLELTSVLFADGTAQGSPSSISQAQGFRTRMKEQRRIARESLNK